MRPGGIDAEVRLLFGGEAAAVSRTGYLTAWMRALCHRSYPPEIANQDTLAGHFLLPHQLLLLRRAPMLTRRLLDWRFPGGAAYFNARTRHFDALLQEQIAAGIEQIVILGAGFDSRGLRFDDRLGAVTVFEVDLQDVIALKARHLAAAGLQSPRRVVPVAVDFAAEALLDKLTAAGYRRGARSFFLWEGVTYYLRDEDVSAVLRFVAEHSGPASTLAFDYVTRAFFEGDETAYGAGPLAQGWRRMGNVNRSGIASASERVAAFGLTLLSDLDAADLERRYQTPAQGPRHCVWGVMRIAHASR